jgi:type II restriction/modification system DNA methylase subunit YeeA
MHIHRDKTVILKVGILLPFPKKSKLKKKNGRIEQIKKGREDENLLCTR